MSKDIIADAFNKIKIYDRLGKSECIVEYSSLMKGVLETLKRHNYIKDYMEITKLGKLYFKVLLLSKIREIKVIKPRYPVKYRDWIRVEQQYLPAYNLGIIIASTPLGILSNIEAKDKKIGGRIIGYVY